jgi:glycosyltransferase involved in cell wall biosynthesis
MLNVSPGATRASAEPVRPARIAVDLTPMLPGGAPGGAKVLAYDLIQRIRACAPHLRLIVLTTPRIHDEVGAVCGPEVERLLIGSDGLSAARTAAEYAELEAPMALLRRGAIHRAGLAVARKLLAPRPVAPPATEPSLRERGVELLFCPFTAPLYAEPGIRVVSILHDLQHLTYPQFFSAEEIEGRNTHLRELKRWADIVVCISEYARHTLVHDAGFDAERTRVVPNAIHDRLPRIAADCVGAVRAQFGLSRDYLLYPANGWPHKNHRLLIAAFGLMRARHPGIDVDLVFTGTFGDTSDDLRTFAHRLGLNERVRWVGHCTSDELAALYEGCRMLVFPSLYEGFGIPLLEAMWFDKPVASSTAASLPEVGGDAVRYFDPRRPEDIVAAMIDVLTHPRLAQELVERGRARVRSFSSNAMALAYAATFDELLRRPPTARNAVTGVYGDGWTREVLHVAYAGGRGRTLEIELEVPAWRPLGGVVAHLESPHVAGERDWRIRPGTRRVLRVDLPSEPGHLSIVFTPAFRPSECGLGDDTRLLGCRCAGVRIAEPGRGGVDLLSPGEVLP